MILTDQTVKRGGLIFSEGDPGSGFYVVVTGKVKIFKLSPDGKEQILHIFPPREPFAEAAIFAGDPYPAHAVAMSASRLFFFSRRSFLELIRSKPDLAMNMMAALSMRLKKFTAMIEALSLKEVPGRLATHLLLLSEQQDHSAEIRLDLAKNSLASLLGTIPETLSRILAKMTGQGLIEANGKVIKILDIDTLEDLAAGERRL
ncbi:MAG: Crp/Fnr family transcriptional regulator [Deltaproteobacteria bacterium]|nr:Crp/Fnr family transcriptional regulator [Deltaproteobacteria bacterium]